MSFVVSTIHTVRYNLFVFLDFPTAGDWEMDDILDDQEYYVPELNFSCGKLFVQVKSPPKKSFTDIHRSTEDDGSDIKIDMIKYEEQKQAISIQDLHHVDGKQASIREQTVDESRSTAVKSQSLT